MIEFPDLEDFFRDLHEGIAQNPQTGTGRAKGATRSLTIVEEKLRKVVQQLTDLDLGNYESIFVLWHAISRLRSFYEIRAMDEAGEDDVNDARVFYKYLSSEKDGLKEEAARVNGELSRRRKA